MKVVIVGGGYGGVRTALDLANQDGIEICLISKTQNFEYYSALYRSATGRSPLEVVIPLKEIFHDEHNVELIQSEITHIDSEHKRVVSETGEQCHYDVLVLAVGQEVNYFGIEGLEENAYTLDSITNAVALREHIRDVVINSRKKQPHFAVVGGGASGVELSAELNNFAKHVAEMQAVKHEKFRISLIEGADRVLPALKPKVSQYALKRLQSLGVDVMLGERVVSADKTCINLQSGKLEADTVIWTAGNRNNHLFRSHEHLFEFAKNTRVIVDEHMRGAKGIYVVGDSADTKYAGMAQTALHDAQYVAKDIINIHNKRSRASYKPKMPIYVVPVGGRYAVLQSEHFILHGLPAWILRRAADFRLFAELEPLDAAVKTWRKGTQRASTY